MIASGRFNLLRRGRFNFSTLVAVDVDSVNISIPESVPSTGAVETALVVPFILLHDGSEPEGVLTMMQ
jgi:hypothetical protein